MDTRTVELLNQLLVLHSRSLPVYLASAQPYRRRSDEKAAEVLAHIVEDQKLMVDRIAHYISDIDGGVSVGEFPMEFTDLHDLSMDYILQQVAARQRNDVATIERLAAELQGDPQAHALAREALGAARAHLQSLEECLESAAS